MFRVQVSCVECGSLDSFIDIMDADKAGWTVNRVGIHLPDVVESWLCPECLRRMVKQHETDEDYRNIHDL